MKLENEDALDNLIICQKCFTLHEEIPIQDGTKACCSECGTILYRYDSKRIDRGLALSITGFIFFVLANVFPLVQIQILIVLKRKWCNKKPFPLGTVFLLLFIKLP